MPDSGHDKATSAATRVLHAHPVSPSRPGARAPAALGYGVTFRKPHADLDQPAASQRLAYRQIGRPDAGTADLNAGRQADGAHWRVRRALETGMIVTYARPFTPTRNAGLPSLKH